MIGYGSVAVNDQLVPIAPKAAFDPMAFGQAFTGPAMWPRQGVYNTPPVLPSPSLQASMAPAAYGQSGSYPFPTAQSDTGSPWSLKKSPVLWVLIFFGVALFMLHTVHYR